MSSRNLIVAVFLATAFLFPFVAAGSDGSGGRDIMCVNLTLDGTQSGLVVAYTLDDAIGVALGSSLNSAGVYAEAIIYPSMCTPADPLSPLSHESFGLPSGPNVPLTP